MKKYWFKPKKYGYGFRPVTVEGWAVTVSLLIMILLAASANGFFLGTVTFKSGVHFFFEMICFCVAFIILFKGKVEGGLHWRWKKGKK